jgi:hypothetical protein
MAEQENYAGEGEVRDNKLAKMALRSVRERWPIPAEERVRVVASMTRIATASADVRAAATAARVLASMDGLNQADEHLADKNERIDSGKATDRIAVDPVVLERPVQPKETE